uniref:C2H2-type domain-containing protein n=1 Tax=Mola mola TaxID=94237 RepID=A0A3Q3WH12_MOLML
MSEKLSFRLQEADVIKLTFSPVTLKSEAEDEEKFQRSQDCGDPKPAQNPGGHSQPDTDSTKDSKSECNSKNQSLSGSKLGRRSRQISNPKTYTRSNTEEAFSCSFCRDTFTQQAHLTEHMELHTGGKQYSSILCGKSFTWPYQLNHHQHVGHQSSELPQHQTRGSKHSGSANSQALLDMGCNPGKISVSSFNHEGDQGKQNVSQKPLKPLSCSVCSRKYSSKSSLRNHMRLHSEGKYVTCSVCKKKFPSRGELDKHMRIHTGEKPFKCSICDKAFIQNSSLTVHMRGHTGEKPFSCSLCEKSYAVKSTLRMHMRKHTGEKPYSCKVCGRSFVRGTILKTHKCQRKAATEMKLLS